jgi:RNA polymerase sigma factor (sigma-70 family)
MADRMIRNESTSSRVKSFQKDIVPAKGISLAKPDALSRALVVEDDPSWQQILGEILSDMGLAVDLASSYADAVDALRKTAHRVAILDLSLGGTDHRNQDGLAVAESVRRLDPGCVVLFLTGFATVELAVQVMKDYGAFTCLRKEMFRRSEFRTAINQALAQAPAEAQQGAGAPRMAEIALSSQSSESKVESEVVLVVEDDAGWRDLLSELLKDAGYTTRTSSSYVEAIGLLKREPFQAAVVDLSLASSLSEENRDGYRLLTSMQKSSVPVIVVSGYAEPARIEQAYQERLIVACLEKQSFDRKSFIRTIQEACSSAAVNPVLQSLTEREREVLTLLAQGLTNKEIAYLLTITQNTVKRHLKSLFAKLEVNTRSAASAKAISMGLDKSN